MSYLQKISRYGKSQLQLIIRGEFVRFFQNISQFFPRWLFKVNSGIVLRTSSPRIIYRKYKNYVFEMANDSDIIEIARLLAIPESVVKSRMVRGDECCIARVKTTANEIVNVMWIHQGSCYIRGLGLDLKLGDNEVYLYGGYTAPEARMKGIFNTAFKFVYDTLEKRGISGISGVVEGWNHNAYNTHLRLNFKPISKIVHVVVFFIKVSVLTNLESKRKRTRIFLKFPKHRVLV